MFNMWYSENNNDNDNDDYDYDYDRTAEDPNFRYVW